MALGQVLGLGLGGQVLGLGLGGQGLGLSLDPSGLGLGLGLGICGLDSKSLFRNPRWRQSPSWIFRLCDFGYYGVLIVWYLCSVPNVVPIYVIITEIDVLMLLTFIR